MEERAPPFSPINKLSIAYLTSPESCEDNSERFVGISHVKPNEVGAIDMPQRYPSAPSYGYGGEGGTNNHELVILSSPTSDSMGINLAMEVDLPSARLPARFSSISSLHRPPHGVDAMLRRRHPVLPQSIYGDRVEHPTHFDCANFETAGFKVHSAVDPGKSVLLQQLARMDVSRQQYHQQSQQSQQDVQQQQRLPTAENFSSASFEVNHQSAVAVDDSVVNMQSLRLLLSDPVPSRQPLVPPPPQVVQSKVSRTGVNGGERASPKSSAGMEQCSEAECRKIARGRTGLCVAHGGGRRCEFDGCGKGARGLLRLCARHGGCRKCTYRDSVIGVKCGTNAVGRTQFCTKHGGGARCTHPGCSKGARGGQRLCSRHFKVWQQAKGKQPPCGDFQGSSPLAGEELSTFMSPSSSLALMLTISPP